MPAGKYIRNILWSG